MAFSLEVAFSVKKKMWSDWASDCMRICKTVYLHSHHVCLSKCLSVSQSPCPCAWFCVRAGQRMEWKWKKKKVLSVSAAWAGSWWEQGGGRLAGRSHALFRHHSDGAQPLGQNTTRFLGTLARASLEKPCTSIRTSPSYSNCSHSTTVGAAFSQFTPSRLAALQFRCRSKLRVTD